MSFFCQAGLEACNFKHRDKCDPCWGRNCNRFGGTKVPRLKETPREPKATEKEKPHQEEVRTRAVSW